MMLIVSVVLGILPLVGVAWTVMNGTLTSVDGLFLSLILLALSGILFLNAFVEARAWRSGNLPAPKANAPRAQKTS